MTCDWMPEALNTIKSFVHLQEGWDSYDGSPIDEETLLNAIEIVGKLASIGGIAKPFIFPMGSGNINFDIMLKNISIEIEVKKDKFLILLERLNVEEEDQYFETNSISLVGDYLYMLNYGKF